MPIPQPKKKEARKDFMTRCMSDAIMIKEYKNTDQRLAVCSATYQKNKK